MLTFFGIGKGDKEKFPQLEQALEIFLNEILFSCVTEDTVRGFWDEIGSIKR